MLGAPRTLGISALAVLLTVGAAAGADAQERPTRPERPDSLRRVADSSRARRDSLLEPVDTAAARSLGLPTQPTRSFPTADTLMNGLLRLEGYSATRYAGDSITLFGETREILLVGAALVERDGSILEAGEVRFQESDCRLEASGTPTPVLFDAGTVLVGEDMRYNTCVHRGTVPTALTSFDQSGVTWYLRGGLEADSASTRIYGASNEITSCEEPTPHYHITANSVKWVSNPRTHEQRLPEARLEHRLLLRHQRLSRLPGLARLVLRQLCRYQRRRAVPLAQPLPLRRRLGLVDLRGGDR